MDGTRYSRSLKTFGCSTSGKETPLPPSQRRDAAVLPVAALGSGRESPVTNKATESADPVACCALLIWVNARSGLDAARNLNQLTKSSAIQCRVAVVVDVEHLARKVRRNLGGVRHNQPVKLAPLIGV